MKTKIYLVFFVTLFTLISKTGFGTVHTVISSGVITGYIFSLDSFAAVTGDTVVFSLSSFHTASEVSEATWLANGTLSNGGFSLPTGGGMMVLTQAKTYYYVCTNHGTSGMKGKITVTGATDINSPAASLKGLEIYPNPVTTSATKLTIKTNLQSATDNQIRIFNMLGHCLYIRENVPSIGSIDVADLLPGVYFVLVKSDEIVQERKLVISR